MVLKRLEDAVADGDAIYAVIRGSAVNNDGMRKVGYTAPGVDGQASVIATALERAEVEPEEIGYVEAHGTATPLGDAVELDALLKVSGGSAQVRTCALGTVKPNIGHLDRASGIAGLIKAALALRHGMLPPSIDFESPGAEVNLGNSPFFINTELRKWETGIARRAGVSSFGLGGTNAHVVLEEAPPRADSAVAEAFQLLVWSGKTPAAVDKSAALLAEFLRHHPDANLADVAFTLATGRSEFDHRAMLVCRDVHAAIEALAHGFLERCAAAQPRWRLIPRR